MLFPINMSILKLCKTILNMVRTKYIKPLSAIIFILSLSDFVSAADRYWIATSAGSVWNNTFNWSTTSGGFPPASVPGMFDVAIFDGGGNADCTMDVIVDVRGINVKFSYGFFSTIIQTSFDIRIGSANAIFSGGSFSGGDATIVINSDLIISGASFTSTMAELRLLGNYTLSGGGFAHNDGTVNFVGSGVQTINSTPTTRFYDMEINKTSGSINLDSPMEIENVMTFTSGVISSSPANSLTFLFTAIAVGANSTSFVRGPLKKQGVTAFFYPVGNGTFYAPVVIDITSFDGDFTTLFTVEYKLETPPNSDMTDGLIAHVSGREYWSFSIENTIPASADITLFYDYACASDIQDVTTGASQDLFMGAYDGAQWNKQVLTTIENSVLGALPTACGTGAETGSIKANIDLTANDPTLLTFATVNGNNPLPIELRSFEAQPDGSEVKLLWSTASETNNAYFAIERISEGLTFYEIGSVQGSNNSNEVLHYSFTDPSPISGINYYRLKQVDFDGSFEYSPVISIDLTNNNSFADLYPNPVKLDFGNKLYFKLNTPETRERMQVKMISMSGAVVYSGFVSIVNNQSYIELAPNTPKGTYIVIFSDGKNINREKITIN